MARTTRSATSAETAPGGAIGVFLKQRAMPAISCYTLKICSTLLLTSVPWKMVRSEFWELYHESWRKWIRVWTVCPLHLAALGFWSLARANCCSPQSGHRRFAWRLLKAETELTEFDTSIVRENVDPVWSEHNSIILCSLWPRFEHGSIQEMMGLHQHLFTFVCSCLHLML